MLYGLAIGAGQNERSEIMFAFLDEYAAYVLYQVDEGGDNE